MRRLAARLLQTLDLLFAQRSALMMKSVQSFKEEILFVVLFVETRLLILILFLNAQVYFVTNPRRAFFHSQTNHGNSFQLFGAFHVHTTARTA